MTKNDDDSNEKKAERVSHIVDIALKILAALVIPIILWGVRLEVSQAVLKTEIEAKERLINTSMTAKETQLRTELQICKEQIGQRYSDYSKIQSIVQSNSQQLGKLTSGMEAANKRLDDIIKFFGRNTR